MPTSSPFAAFIPWLTAFTLSLQPTSTYPSRVMQPFFLLTESVPADMAGIIGLGLSTAVVALWRRTTILEDRHTANLERSISALQAVAEVVERLAEMVEKANATRAA